MPFTLTMPKMSPTMEEGTIAKWHKKEGEFVSAGDVVFEVATDKATVEYEAIDEGWLRKIIIGENDEAIVNQAVAIFTEEEKESIEGYKPEGIDPQAAAQPAEENESEEQSDSPAKKAPAAAAGAMAQAVFVPEEPLTDYVWEEESGAHGGRIASSPLARKLAEEKGLDIGTAPGSGPGGRVMARDLDKARPQGFLGFGRHERPSTQPGSYEEEGLSPMRKVIGKRLQEAKTFIPHFYVTQKVDAVPMTEIREQLKSEGVKVTFNDFVVRACSLALRKFPTVNSGFNSVSNSIIRFKSIDVAIAVSVDGGLITPILRHSDYMNLGRISSEVRRLAGLARKGKLQPHEYKGGSFTISNLGMYGVSEFQAVISPPQAAILAVSGILDVPVVKNGEIVPGKTMSISLSSDHRVIDGALAAEFVNCVTQFLENPALLLI